MIRKRLKFEKYQGTGNDFIMIDNRDGSFVSEDLQLVKLMCDRHFGIGSDGLILIESAENVDFHMEFFNPDGSKSFCGNGSRCAVKFAQKTGVFSGDKCSFTAIDGIHEAQINEDLVRVKMRAVSEVVTRNDGMYMHTGSPHHLCFDSALPQGDIKPLAQPIRYAADYQPGGVNVNFVAKEGNGISMRTYERGVEEETLSCGTGVTAAALGSHLQFALPSPIQVTTKGGMLNVYFEKEGDSFDNIWLEGPAAVVFEGIFEI